MSVSSPTGPTAPSTPTTSGSAIAQTGTAALSGLSSNFSTFLTMLMTQLQNQDPTSPLDTSQFTSELVQFSSVEQQINTNTNLTQLISLTQASQIEQSSSMLGKPATVTSSKLVLQDGQSAINFNTTNPEPIVIAVTNAAGAQVQSATLTSSAGANSWTWNGQTSSGATLPDGAYTVTVNTVGSDGKTAAVPFTATGTVTSVQNDNGTVNLQMGGLTVPFSAVKSVGS